MRKSKFQLQARDKIILHLLSLPPQVGFTAEEIIFYLWFVIEGKKIEVTNGFKQSLRRRFKQMEQQKLIQKTRFLDETKFHYFMQMEGLMIVNSEKETPITLKPRANNFTFAKHQKMIGKTWFHLLLSERDQIEKYDILETQLALEDSDFLIPDAVVALTTKEKERLLFIEVDNNTESKEVVQEKLMNYLWLFSQENGENNETLLVIAPSIKRLNLFYKSLKTFLEKMEKPSLAGSFYFTQSEFLTNEKNKIWAKINHAHELIPNSFKNGCL